MIGAGLRRVPARSRGTARGRTYSWPAPTAGWVTNLNLAASKQGSCRVLENAFPTSTGVRVRGGTPKAATIGSDAVAALIPYNAPGGSHFFAASAGAIYDVSALDPTTAPSADITGLTSGDWSHAQITTTGGSFLVLVNGSDAMRRFDGSSWTTVTSAITGVTTADLSHVWLYRNRLFFVEQGTLDAWFLPIESISGAAQKVALGAVFRRGGALSFGSTWSLDAGDGVDDKCVFVTDQGELAVYEGGNPASADDWRLVGRFDITRPLGPRATMQAGGDLLVATEEGLVPVSEALTKDPSALTLSAVSRAIEPTWRDQGRSAISGQKVSLLKYPREGLLVVSWPHTGSDCYVVNLQTGAWARYTGLDAQCTGLYDGYAYFGTSAGAIRRFETGGSDDGALYTARIGFAADAMRAVAAHKQVHLARATFVSVVPFDPLLSLAADYDETFPSPPSAVTNTAAPAVWGTAVWGSSIWGGSGSDLPAERRVVSTRWVGAPRNGFALSPQVQISCSGTRRPDAELVAFDVLYEQGGVVV